MDSANRAEIAKVAQRRKDDEAAAGVAAARPEVDSDSDAES
jgi:hypothetical protein